MSSFIVRLGPHETATAQKTVAYDSRSLIRIRLKTRDVCGIKGTWLVWYAIKVETGAVESRLKPVNPPFKGLVFVWYVFKNE
jgi:hypothetical protein